MSIVQSFLPYSNSTVAQYTAWAQGIGSALSTIGWTKVADPGGVTWANITSTVNIPQTLAPLGGTILSSPLAWAGGTSYTGGNQSISSQSNFSIVTNAGLTWACVNATQQVLNSSGIGPLVGSTANQNSSNTLNITSVANASGGFTVYTGTGFNATSNFYAGFLFVVTGSTVPANNGVFICGASTATTLTLSNPIGTTAATQTITAVSSSANISYFANANVASWQSNAQAGHSWTFSGFTGGAAVNNGTFTVLASNNILQFTGTQGVLVVQNTGSSVTVGGTLATDNTAPTGYSTAPISSTTVTSNVLTVTAANNFAAGVNVVLTGVSTSTFLNGQTVTVLSSGLSSAQFKANFTHADYGATPDTGQATAGDNNHWIPYNYEIWKTNGSNSSVAPIYLKIVYSTFGSQVPMTIIDVGSANPSTGLIGGNHLSEQALGFNNASGVGNTFECDFSGDADNFAWIMWRNGTSINLNIPTVLFIDRTRDPNGNSLSTFFNVGMVTSNSAVGLTSRPFWTLFNAATGGVITFANQWPFPFVQAPAGLAYQGLTPVLPLFAMPGYIANPCLMAVAMQQNDFTDGQLINAVFYGGSHTFLMSHGIPVSNTSVSSTAFPGIRWE